MEFVGATPSPPIFQRWCALMTISGALERKVHVYTYERQLFPNMFVFLTSDPGVGKTFVTDEVLNFWKRLPALHVAPDSVTKASLMDALNDAPRTFTDGKKTVNFNGLQTCVNELGVFLPAYDGEFISILTDLWDCKSYHETRRSSKLEIKLDRTQLTLLAATTPSYLTSMLPEGAWDQGFLSRCICVYSGARKKQSLFAVNPKNEKLRKDLNADLRVINKLKGAFTFSNEAEKRMETWHLNYGPPQPEHPKLRHYCIRRSTHLLKLCMVVSASQSDEMEITEDHFNEALETLLEAEAAMPDIFKAMHSGNEVQIQEELWYFALEEYQRKNAPVPEFKLIDFLRARMPSDKIDTTLKIMVSAKALKYTTIKGLGTGYIPQSVGLGR